MKKLGVFTSGGDAPGMNAAVRAVVRGALYRGVKVEGIMRGYTGMITGEFKPMEASSVSNIIQRGGTIIKTSRSEEFMLPAGREKAVQMLKQAGIEGLVAIGGDGTFHGAHALWEEHAIPIIGVPGTIDNDLYGTDYTIGYDTAINTALDAIDKIRDTADSHERLFFVEVMGRNSGAIALDVAVAGGAEAVVIPEAAQNAEGIARILQYATNRGKTSMIFVIAEGADCGDANSLANEVKELTGREFKVTVLGYIQRGGGPTAEDRVLASKLGIAAVDALLAGETDKMAGQVSGQVVLTPLPLTWQKRKPLDMSLLEMLTILSS